MSTHQDGDAPLIDAASMESIRMPGGLPSTAGFLRFTSSGDLEIEFYDFGERAQSSFGNDVATTYTVRHGDLPTLLAALSTDQGVQAPGADVRQVLVAKFSGVLSLVAWIKEEGIPFTTSFDSWA